MLSSEIRTKTYENGEFQRVHTVRADSFDEIDMLYPQPDKNAFSHIVHVYRRFLVPAAPYIFGRLVLFCLPEGMTVPFSRESKKYGSLFSPLAAAAAALRGGVRIDIKGRPHFKNEELKAFWQELEKRGCVDCVCGMLPDTVILPVSDKLGLLTQCEPDARLKANTSFFVFDRFDCATVYDSIGTPIGLNVKDGRIISPPLFGREALIADKNGSVSITRPKLKKLGVIINGKKYRHGENCRIYERPDRRRTPAGRGEDIVIIGSRVEAVKKAGRTDIPAAGFVLRPFEGCKICPGDIVDYSGMEDIGFALQVANSAVIEGKKTEKLISPFCNIRIPGAVSFPPSLYPLDYKGARAPRMAIGADREGHPMLLWAEGAGKNGYKRGEESCGASLADMAELCFEAGMYNAVNLDGGGSAQILLNNCRSLKISDRLADDSESERAVPAGIIIR